jgi:Eukaryotic aspartyl protease
VRVVSFFLTSVLTCSMPSEKISGVETPLLAADVAEEGFSPVDAQALVNNTLTPANPPSAPNSLGLDIVANDVGYVAVLQMGTPPRDFNILMDSGSADLWVGAEQCVSEDGSDCVRPSFPQLLYIHTHFSHWCRGIIGFLDLCLRPQ